jgi:DNA-binding transcriptional LysR family regulator
MSTSLLALGSMMEPLRGFVAVGRRMSITLAAADLCITQSALSRQVQTLEERLGVKLFKRGHRSIAFTSEGERLFRSANGALQQLQDTFAVIASDAKHRPVTLSASVGVTGLWILPKLGSFQQQHPHIDLRVAANNRILDLASEGIDLAIRYVKRGTISGNATLLFDETVAPIAHPSLKVGSITSAKDISRHVLLEYDDPRLPWLHWDDWLAAAGWQGAKPKGTLRFNQYDQMIHSALAGQGIALGRMQLIRALLADGRLMEIPTSNPGLSNDYSYWLLRADNEPRSEVAAVIDWILTETTQ